MTNPDFDTSINFLAANEINNLLLFCEAINKANGLEGTIEDYRSLSSNYYYNLKLKSAANFEETEIISISESVSVDGKIKEFVQDETILNHVKDYLKPLIKQTTNSVSISIPCWKRERLDRFANLHPLDVILSTKFTLMLSRPKMGKTSFMRTMTSKLMKNLKSIKAGNYDFSDLSNDTFYNILRDEKNIKNNPIIPFYFNIGYGETKKLIDDNSALADYFNNIYEEYEQCREIISNYRVLIFVDGIDEYVDKNDYTESITTFVRNLEEFFNIHYEKNRPVPAYMVICCEDDFAQSDKLEKIHGPKESMKTFNLVPLDKNSRRSFLMHIYHDNNQVDELLKVLDNCNLGEELISSPYILRYIAEVYDAYLKDENRVPLMLPENYLLKHVSKKIIEDMRKDYKKDRGIEDSYQDEKLDALFERIISQLAWVSRGRKTIGEELFWGIITKLVIDDDNLDSDSIEFISGAIVKTASIIIDINPKPGTSKRKTYKFLSNDFVDYFSAQHLINESKSDEKIVNMIYDDKNKGMLMHFFYECDKYKKQSIFKYLMGISGKTKLLGYKNIYYAVRIYCFDKECIDERDIQFFREAATSYFLKHNEGEVKISDFFEPSLEERIEIGNVLCKDGNDLDIRFPGKNDDPVEDIKMVRINKGSFMYGLNRFYKDLYTEQKLVIDYNREACINFQTQKVEIKNDFEMSKYPITVGQYKAFINDGGYDPDAEHWQFSQYSKDWIKKTRENIDKSVEEYLKKHDTDDDEDDIRFDIIEGPDYLDTKEFGDNMPQVNLAWVEIMAFIKWLSKKTGKTYRLPYEEEWEYAARRMNNEEVELSFDLSKLVTEDVDDIKAEIVAFNIEDDSLFKFAKEDFSVVGIRKKEAVARNTILNDDFSASDGKDNKNKRDYNHFLVLLNRGIPPYVENCQITIRLIIKDKSYDLIFKDNQLVNDKESLKPALKNIHLEAGEKFHEFSWGNYPQSERAISNNMFKQPAPVGIFERELSGDYLCDMNGNVWEWTQSEFFEDDQCLKLDCSNHIDETRINKSTKSVVRGGSYMNDIEMGRNTFRGRDLVGDRIKLHRQGFRILRELEEDE